MGEFYFNLETHEVEEGKVSDWRARMGPYPTREAAGQALQEAARRTKAWDDEDRRREQERED